MRLFFVVLQTLTVFCIASWLFQEPTNAHPPSPTQDNIFLINQSESTAPEETVLDLYPQQEAIIPLSHSPRALVLKAKIDGSPSKSFVLDTGATYTSISRDLALKLGLDLRHAKRVSVTTANGEIEVPKVILNQIRVQGVTAYNVEATVLDFKDSNDFSGLLGLSFINQFKLTIDPDARELRLKSIES